MRQATTNLCSARRGVVVIYGILVMIMLLSLSALAIDWGRNQLVKTELQSAADAAARQGCVGLKVSTGQAQTLAMSAAAFNTANGTSVVLNASQDIQFGTWDPATRTFELLTSTNQKSATAIRIYTRRTVARGNGIPTTFGQAFGLRDSDVTAMAIAARGNIVTANVAAKGSPWLAGMPSGSTVPPYGGNNQGCTAPENSPAQINNFPLVSGTPLMFRQTNGQTSYKGSGQYGPDGQTDWIVRQNPVNGINATSAPIMALVGIFLDDRRPDSYGMAPQLDFTSPESRNFSSLSPQLKQVFFIGDGMDSNGNLQQFVVPSGATRFYLGLMDEKGWWWDNVGTLSTTMLDDNVALVQ
jgi:Flp pilus assembly protein TadG